VATGGLTSRGWKALKAGLAGSFVGIAQGGKEMTNRLITRPPFSSSPGVAPLKPQGEPREVSLPAWQLGDSLEAQRNSLMLRGGFSEPVSWEERTRSHECVNACTA